jgi:formylglycine-generating enzyme required for sulfatase activity
MRVRGPLIALAVLLQGAAPFAAESLAPDPGLGPDAEWDWEAQREYFRARFGDPTEKDSPDWARKQYDPSPAVGQPPGLELTLPMPCNGAMVFRRIEVAGDRGWLGQQQIELGGPGDDDAPIASRRLDYIAGTFANDERDPEAGRHYYLGKYEVTELQFRALGEVCPNPPEGRRPAVRVSWYDAVDFTRRYTEWLNRRAPEQLPRVDGVRGYLRLPTEVEWEYAARGGLAVDHDEFQAALFPTDSGSIDDYAWVRESVASSFEPHPVGSLLPNPLGLHDILGNASELVFDLFRLSVRGRTHSQPGGFLVKGGHFRTWRSAIRSAWRQEHPHFNPVTGAANRLDTVGFRVAISAPVLTSEQRVRALREEWRHLPPASVPPDAAKTCRDLAAEVRALLADLNTSLEPPPAQAEGLSLPAFPPPPLPPGEPPQPLPDWNRIRDGLHSLDNEGLRRHGLWLLQAGRPDRAAALFERAAAQGDGWSALALGALHDPLVSEAQAFGPGASRTAEADAERAMHWYRRARALGEGQAAVRIRMLEARGTGADCGHLVSPRAGAP